MTSLEEEEEEEVVSPPLLDSPGGLLVVVFAFKRPFAAAEGTARFVAGEATERLIERYKPCNTIRIPSLNFTVECKHLKDKLLNLLAFLWRSSSTESVALVAIARFVYSLLLGLCSRLQ